MIRKKEDLTIILIISLAILIILKGVNYTHKMDLIGLSDTNAKSVVNVENKFKLVQTDIIAQQKQKVPLQIVDNETIDTAIIHDGTLIPKVLHFVWISTNWNQKQPEIPTRIRNRINLWNNTHPDWSVVIWTNVLVERHFPELYMASKRIKTEAWVSDIIRYHVIARYGGIYIDTDIVPLRVLPSKLLENAFTVCQVPRDGTRCILTCNAVIGSPRGNPEMELVASQALRGTEIYLNSHKKKYNLYVTGPPFWSTFTTRSNSSIKILPATTFYPCDWKEPHACKKEKYIGNQNVYAMHLWEHSWA